MNRLFVGNIPYTQNEESLAEWFASQGFQTSVIEIIQDRMTNRPRGFGFVELAQDGQAESAIRALNGKLFAGRPLTVSWATPVRQTA